MSDDKFTRLADNCGALVVLAFLISIVVFPIAILTIGRRIDKATVPIQQQDSDDTSPNAGQKRFITLPIEAVEEYVWQDDKSVPPQDSD